MTTFTRIAALTAGIAALAAPALAAPAWNGSYDTIPAGSYQASCRDISAFNGQLYARCVGQAGGLFDTSIAYRNCSPGGIVNINGTLRCGGGGNGGNGGWNGGGGGWGGAPGLIVYENPDYRGMRLEVSDAIPDLMNSGLDDQITSIRVLRGSWQVCAGRDFNGQCWTISADTPNLKTLGANDKISSIRRVGR